MSDAWKVKATIPVLVVVGVMNLFVLRPGSSMADKIAVVVIFFVFGPLFAYQWSRWRTRVGQQISKTATALVAASILLFMCVLEALWAYSSGAMKSALPEIGICLAAAVTVYITGSVFSGQAKGNH